MSIKIMINDTFYYSNLSPWFAYRLFQLNGRI